MSKKVYATAYTRDCFGLRTVPGTNRTCEWQGLSLRKGHGREHKGERLLPLRMYRSSHGVLPRDGVYLLRGGNYVPEIEKSHVHVGNPILLQKKDDKRPEGGRKYLKALRTGILVVVINEVNRLLTFPISRFAWSVPWTAFPTGMRRWRLRVRHETMRFISH